MGMEIGESVYFIDPRLEILERIGVAIQSIFVDSFKLQTSSSHDMFLKRGAGNRWNVRGIVVACCNTPKGFGVSP